MLRPYGSTSTSPLGATRWVALGAARCAPTPPILPLLTVYAVLSVYAVDRPGQRV